MDDPEAKKPEGWDDIPKTVADPEAKKPEDWDDDLDGEWEAPQIKNPAYKGVWVHPQVPNPDYHADDSIYAYENEYVAFEIWQVKSGTLFDHILITDDIAEAEAFATGYFAEQQKGEKSVYEAQEEERRKVEEEERKTREAEAEEEGDDDDDDDDDDDHDDHHGHDHDHDDL